MQRFYALACSMCANVCVCVCVPATWPTYSGLQSRENCCHNLTKYLISLAARCAAALLKNEKQNKQAAAATEAPPLIKCWQRQHLPAPPQPRATAKREINIISCYLAWRFLIAFKCFRCQFSCYCWSCWSCFSCCSWCYSCCCYCFCCSCCFCSCSGCFLCVFYAFNGFYWILMFWYFLLVFFCFGGICLSATVGGNGKFAVVHCVNEISSPLPNCPPLLGCTCKSLKF